MPRAIQQSPPRHTNSKNKATEKSPSKKSPAHNKLPPSQNNNKGAPNVKVAAKTTTARITKDGTILPATKATLLPDGTYARPRGQAKKGCKWDKVRGVWVSDCTIQANDKQQQKKSNPATIDKTTSPSKESTGNSSKKHADADNQVDDAPVNRKSNYIGVKRNRKGVKWSSSIALNKKCTHLGSFTLETDAALAYDEAKLIKEERQVNFKTLNEYKKAKEIELNMLGLSNDDAMTQTEIQSKVLIIATSNKKQQQQEEQQQKKKKRSHPPTIDNTMAPAKKKANKNVSNSRNKSSNYIGVCRSRRDGDMWRSRITFNKQQAELGEYTLETDAALAFDEAAKLIKEVRVRDAQINFKTLNEYTRAKEDEINKLGLSIDDALSQAAIQSKVSIAIVTSDKQLGSTKTHAKSMKEEDSSSRHTNKKAAHTKQPPLSKQSAKSTTKQPASSKQSITQQKKKEMSTEPLQLFSFDAYKTNNDSLLSERPKRKIKSISRFDPALKEKKGAVKIGYGFACPECGNNCTYDSRQCNECHLECCYEAGVGVVILQDRRIDYNAFSNPKMKSTSKVAEKKVSATQDRVNRKRFVSKSTDDGNSNLPKTGSLNGDNGSDGVKNDTESASLRRRKKPRLSTDLPANLKVATNTTLEFNVARAAAPNKSDDSTIVSKGGSYSSLTSSISQPIQEKEGISKKSKARKQQVDVHSTEANSKFIRDTTQQLSTLQSKHDSILASMNSTEKEFKATLSKLDDAILQRNQDAASFSKSLASSNAKIADIKKKVASLIADRDEFVKQVESRGLPLVSSSALTSNYSTRIDSLETRVLKLETDCDAAKERVKDLISTKDLADIETKQKEIEHLKQQLSEHRSKITTMATEKAFLVEKIASTSVQESKVRRTAEEQASRILELESTIASLETQKDDADARVKRTAEDQASKILELESSIALLKTQKDDADKKLKRPDSEVKKIVDEGGVKCGDVGYKVSSFTSHISFDLGFGSCETQVDCVCVELLCR